MDPRWIVTTRLGVRTAEAVWMTDVPPLHNDSIRKQNERRDTTDGASKDVCGVDSGFPGPKDHTLPETLSHVGWFDRNACLNFQMQNLIRALVFCAC